MAGNMVRVVNKSDKDFVDGYDGNRFKISSNGEAFVPLDAIEVWLGNPNALDLSENQRDRKAEYDRLRVRYGAYEFDDRWENNKPNLEVYTLEGERVTTVVDDPAGDNITVEQTTRLQNKMLSDELANMRQQLKTLENLVGDEDRSHGGEGATVKGPKDQPDNDKVPLSLEPDDTEVIEEDKPNRVKVSSKG